MPLSFQHEGNRCDTLVRLAGVHSSEELLSKVQGRLPAQPIPEEPMPPQPRGPRRGERPGAPDKPPQDGQPPDKPGDKPAEKQGDKPRMPRPPRAIARRPGAAPMPPVVKEHFQTRRGYANYYFNKLYRDQTWQRFVARGDFTGAKGDWTLRGECGAGLAGQGDAELRVSSALCSIALPGGRLQHEMTDDLTGAVDPPGSGGLLAALHLWRRMLVLGPEKFGDVYYLGTVPLVGHDGLTETLVATYGGVECRFMFDPALGHLLAMEVYLRSDDDPCELRFADYAEFEGRMLPKLLEVRHGDQLYASIKMTAYKLDKEAVQKEAGKSETEKTDTGKTETEK